MQQIRAWCILGSWHHSNNPTRAAWISAVLENGPRNWLVSLLHQVLCKQGEIGDQFYAIIESRTDTSPRYDGPECQLLNWNWHTLRSSQIHPQEYLPVCSRVK